MEWGQNWQNYTLLRQMHGTFLRTNWPIFGLVGYELFRQILGAVILPIWNNNKEQKFNWGSSALFLRYIISSSNKFDNWLMQEWRILQKYEEYFQINASHRNIYFKIYQIFGKWWNTCTKWKKSTWVFKFRITTTIWQFLKHFAKIFHQA